MSKFPIDSVGAAWLADNYEVYPIADWHVRSQIGTRRITQIVDGKKVEIYPESMRPINEPFAHLQFHLRHEILHLEFLMRLFTKTGSSFIQAWIDAEPTGQYSRRAAFLYEWLTGDLLEPPARIGGRYVDAIDSASLVTASPEYVEKVSRWHINNNLPGTRYFCPMIVKSEAVMQAMSLDIPSLFEDLSNELGEDLLQRASVWMTLRESKASFAIEGEADRTRRIERFADVMARRTGIDELPLNEKSLAQLQQEILGEATTITHFGLRSSPVFVGETVNFQEVVHFVAPPADDVVRMLKGLHMFFERTQGQSAVMRSAVVSFGFIYIHPMADGNGRIHRFLINDVLRRDGAIHAPIILPISAVLTADLSERRRYDQVLDEISKPLMQSVREYIEFTPMYTTYADGVVSNFAFSGVEQAYPIWRYPSLDAHIVFLAEIIQRTIRDEMNQQARYLRRHARARQALKEIVEMPDLQADRVLRSIEQNDGKLSNVLAKEMPILSKPGIWPELVAAVNSALAEDVSIDRLLISRYGANRSIDS